MYYLIRVRQGLKLNINVNSVHFVQEYGLEHNDSSCVVLKSVNGVS